MAMHFAKLFPQACSSPLIRELTLDSRKVRPGDLFLAVPGLDHDGRDFIVDAIARGAAAVVYEEVGAQPMQDSDTLLLPVQGLQKQLSAIAGRFYGEPSRTLEVVAVTGTNGKTSVTQLLAQASDQLGQPCGLIGTLGSGLRQFSQWLLHHTGPFSCTSHVSELETCRCQSGCHGGVLPWFSTATHQRRRRGYSSFN